MAWTIEDMKNLQKTLETTRERVKGNREEAIRVLQAAGITTKKGKLTSPYRVKNDK